MQNQSNSAGTPDVQHHGQNNRPPKKSGNMNDSNKLAADVKGLIAALQKEIHEDKKKTAFYDHGKNKDDSAPKKNSHQASVVDRKKQNSNSETSPSNLKNKSKKNMVGTRQSNAKERLARKKHQKTSKESLLPEANTGVRIIKFGEKVEADTDKKKNRRDPYSSYNPPKDVIQDNKDSSILDAVQYRNLSPRELTILQENQITPMKKVKPKFPLACYFCNICDYHCDNLQIVSKHIAGDRHMGLKASRDMKRTLKHLPSPNKAHEMKLNSLLKKIHEENGLNDEDLQFRQGILKNLADVITREFPDCNLQLYGSSLSGFGLKTSDVNLHLNLPEKADHAMFIDQTYKLLLNNPETNCSNVVSDFMAKIPAIILTDIKSGLKCSIDINNNFAVQTSQLLSIHRELDPRVPVIGTAFGLWAKVCRVNQQSFGTMPSYAYMLMLINFCQQCSPPVLPIIDTANPIKPDWKSENKSSVASLWLQLLRYFTVKFNYGENVINIRQTALLTMNEKNWGARKIAIEDPYSLKRNVARSISHSSIFDHILERLQRTFLYYGIPQLNHGALFHTLSTKPIKNSKDKDEPSHPAESMRVIGHPGASDVLDDVAKGQGGASAPRTYGNNLSSLKEAVPIEEIIEQMKHVTVDDLTFRFDEEVLTNGKLPPLICRLCQKKGHVDDDCPEEQLPAIIDLPPMTKEFIATVDSICKEIMSQYSPAESDNKRSVMLADLEAFIRQSHPEAKLEMFGSSCNGFGFHNSDLDICLTFEGNSTGEGLDFSLIVEQLAERLQTRKDLHSVAAIPTAKVPIVKFTYIDSELEVDISLYNTLALHNTSMLRTYCKLDKRLQVLGYCLKLFAKLCDIGAAARGSLSSYAYILMVIYFLQQRKPAVLPVLQELHQGPKKPETIIDESNVWFYDDLNNLPSVWEDYGKNTESIGQLWVGLFEFYAKEFDFTKNVITIRQKEPLTRLSKLWSSKCIAIEDPFDLSHNLGAGVSRKMNSYILKAFIKGREIFGHPIQQPPRPYQFMEDYLFDPDVLTDGVLPPNNRGCFLCGNIGHKVKECPKRTPKKGKREDKMREGKNDRYQQQEQINAVKNRGDQNYRRNANMKLAQSPPKGMVGRRNNMDNRNVGNFRESNERNPMYRNSNVANASHIRDGLPFPGQQGLDMRNQLGRPDLPMNSMHNSRHMLPSHRGNSQNGQRIPFPPPNMQNKDNTPLDDPAIISCIPSKQPLLMNPPHMPLGPHDGFPPFSLNSSHLPPPFNEYASRFQTPHPFQFNPECSKGNTTITPSSHPHAHQQGPPRVHSSCNNDQHPSQVVRNPMNAHSSNDNPTQHYHQMDPSQQQQQQNNPANSVRGLNDGALLQHMQMNSITSPPGFQFNTTSSSQQSNMMRNSKPYSEELSHVAGKAAPQGPYLMDPRCNVGNISNQPARHTQVQNPSTLQTASIPSVLNEN